MWHKILHAKVVSGVSLIALLLTLGGAIWARVALGGISGTPLILHFDDLTGITSVGTSATLIFVGIFGVAIVLMNFFIALELDARDRFLGKLTAAATLIFAALLFIAFAAIINVN